MVFPLMPREPVVFRHPVTDEILTGEVASRADSRHDTVSIAYMNKNRMEVIKKVHLSNMRVVKATDYLIYSGARFFVFGPPPCTISQLTWGSAWLDVVAEQMCFSEQTQATEKLLYELKRLDVVMLGYPDVPDCAVLVLGFLQGTDDSDWKAIGLLNCEDDDILETEQSAAEHICFIAMTDLRRDYSTTRTCVVDQEIELWMTTNPSVKAYHHAMSYIQKWSGDQPRWLPRKTWRAKVMSMHSKNSKSVASRGKEPAKLCSSCQTLEKQYGRVVVSPLTVCVFLFL
jgi:hypothetical protein